MIPVQPEDQKVLQEADIIAAAGRTEAASAWKQHHWGTPRDERLIARLMAMPRLSRLAKEPPKDPDSVSPHRKRHWFKGQGFQPATGSTQVPDKVFWDVDDLFISAGAPVDDLVLLLRTNCDKIGNRYSSGLHRKRSPLIYKSPLVLINQACTKFLFSDFDVLFQHDFQSICGPQAREAELLFLTAVLASPLTQYLLFHTTAEHRHRASHRPIGRDAYAVPVARRYAEQGPLPNRYRRMCHPIARLKRNCSSLQNLLKRTSLVQQTKQKLNKLVYDYFGVCGWERYLIEDTEKVFRPSSTPSSLDSNKLFTADSPSGMNGKRMPRRSFRLFVAGRDKGSLWARSCIAQKLGLGFVTFGVGGRAKIYKETAAENQVEELLDRIRKSSTQSEGTIRYLRGFVF